MTRTTFQITEADREIIKTLVNKLVPELGGKVSQRVAVMYAVNKALKELNNAKN